MAGKVLHASQLQVRFFDLDLSSTVFFTNYMKWFDGIAAEEFMRSRGINWEKLNEDNIDVAIANINFDYKLSLFMNDIVDICIEDVVLGNKSMQLHGSFYKHDNGALVASGKIVYVFVDTGSRRPIAVPDLVRDKLK